MSDAGTPRRGRRTGELIRLVADLAARDIGVRSLTEPIDTTTPAGRTILETLAVLARTEANISEKAPTPASPPLVPTDDTGAGQRSLPPPTSLKLIDFANPGQA
jgi:hypothetical protein